MILVKNKLKKKKISQDDNYLDYIKYSHLPPIHENNEIKTSDASTQFPITRNRRNQTDDIEVDDKEMNTEEYEDTEGMFELKTSSQTLRSDADRRIEESWIGRPHMKDNKTQVNHIPIFEVSSSSSDSEGVRGVFKHHKNKIKAGIRLAQLSGSATSNTVSASIYVADFFTSSKQAKSSIRRRRRK